MAKDHEQFGLNWVLAVIFWAALLAAFFAGITMVEVSKIQQGKTLVVCK